MNWDYYRYFLATARSGSLKQAAQKLKVNQTTVGRNITALEEEMGTRLFERRSDGFILTSAGQRILKSMQEVEEKVIAAERVLAGKDEKPEGTVKIAMPGALANHWLIPLLGPFVLKHPGVNFQFLTGPELVNLARREADLAIRLVKPTQTDLIARRIGSMNLRLYGHKKLFSDRPAPKRTGDLEKLPFIGLTPEATSAAESALLKQLAGPFKIRCRSASWSSVYSAVTNSIGIGILPTFMADKNRDLMPILSNMSGSMPVWLVYHPDLKHAARVRVIIEFISDLMEKDFA